MKERCPFLILNTNQNVKLSNYIDLINGFEDEKMMDIFRRIIHTGEISERAYHLAGEVVRKMCGSYSAWYDLMRIIY